MAIHRVSTRALALFGLGMTGLIACTLLIYWPGIQGPFILDDFGNLAPLGEQGGVDSVSSALQFVLGNQSGPLGRPLAMLSFLVDAQNWPTIASNFKYTNILLHVLNGVLLCWMTVLLAAQLQLGESQRLALGLLVGALWLLHPLHVSTTLYVVQRMTQLMTVFVLAALICYLKGRAVEPARPKLAFLYLCLALFPFGLLALLSKENGVSLLLLLLVFEKTVFRDFKRSGLWLLWFRLGILLPLAIVAVYLLVTFGDTLATYESRHFSLWERLLTEARVLCLYLLNVFVPNPSGSGLFHDGIEISSSLVRPLTTLPSIAVVFALLYAAFRARKTHAVFSLGVFWFFAAHALESTFIPLEIYFEHRNYLPMMGPALTAGWYLLAGWRRESSAPGSGLGSKAYMATIGGFLLVSAGLTWQQSNIWSSTDSIVLQSAQAKPKSIRAQVTYSNYLADRGDTVAAMEQLEAALALAPNELSILLQSWNHHCRYDVPARYSLEQIVALDNLEYFHNNINYLLSELLQLYLEQSCEFPSTEVLLELFDTVDNLPLSDSRRAVFHMVYSELFVILRRLDPALIQLSRAFSYDANPEIPVRQAFLSGTAGNYNDALVFLERARTANSSSLIPSTDLEQQINAMEQEFNVRL